MWWGLSTSFSMYMEPSPKHFRASRLAAWKLEMSVASFRTGRMPLATATSSGLDDDRVTNFACPVQGLFLVFNDAVGARV